MEKKRDVPFSLKIISLFGGGISQFGWLFFGFSMIFFWGLVMNADFSGIYYKFVEMSYATATVLDVKETGASVNEHEVVKVTYRFSTPKYGEFTGFSYCLECDPDEGSTVKVEYPKDKPWYSRIKGMRRKMFSPYVAFVTIFPLAGLILVLAGLVSGLKTIKLLKSGTLAYAPLTNKEKTNVLVNDSPVYKLTFTFEADNGRKYTCVTKTHLTDDLEDDPKEALLYNPQNPSHNVMLDTLSGKPQFDESGRLNVDRESSSQGVLILPLITIVGHGLWVWLAYF